MVYLNSERHYLHRDSTPSPSRYKYIEKMREKRENSFGLNKDLNCVKTDKKSNRSSLKEIIPRIMHEK